MENERGGRGGRNVGCMRVLISRVPVSPQKVTEAPRSLSASDVIMIYRSADRSVGTAERAGDD